MARRALTLGGGPPGQDRPLRMRGEDTEDLRIISAYLQDAIVPIVEMAYQQAERRFVLVAQRFRWEKVRRAGTSSSEERPDERVHCGVRFEEVERVRVHGIDMADKSQMLNLLAVHGVDGSIDLAFADGKTIRLEVGRTLCQIEDLGEPWPTFNRPSHVAAEDDASETGTG